MLVLDVNKYTVNIYDSKELMKWQYLSVVERQRVRIIARQLSTSCYSHLLLFLDFACQKVRIKWSHWFVFKSVGLKLR